MARRRMSPRFFKHKVTVQSESRSVDAMGGASSSWATHAQVWANVHPLSGRELFAAGQLQGEVSHRVTIRYYSTVTQRMRILWGSRVLRILSVVNADEDDQVMELLCQEERV